MNNITLNRLNRLKNKIFEPTSNIQVDNYLEELEELNKTIWTEEDYEIAKLNISDENT